MELASFLLTNCRHEFSHYRRHSNNSRQRRPTRPLLHKPVLIGRRYKESRRHTRRSSDGNRRRSREPRGLLVCDATDALFSTLGAASSRYVSENLAKHAPISRRYNAVFSAMDTRDDEILAKMMWDVAEYTYKHQPLVFMRANSEDFCFHKFAATSRSFARCCAKSAKPSLVATFLQNRQQRRANRSRQRRQQPAKRPRRSEATSCAKQTAYFRRIFLII